jgi:nucleotide-binding universal stress UspA family protein
MTVLTRIEYGPPAETISRLSDDLHADLIVMATHGRGGLKRMWLGSVAVKVVHLASQPVLLVRSKERVEQSERTPRAQHAALPQNN